MDFRNDKIALLVLDTHGDTNDRNESHLDLLDKISETSVDNEFREIFDGIKTRFKKDARIVLQTCSTFYGSQGSVNARAITLLKYFGAENGSIFGHTQVSSVLKNSLTPSLHETAMSLLAGMLIFNGTFLFEIVSRGYVSIQGLFINATLEDGTVVRVQEASRYVDDDLIYSCRNASIGSRK